MALIQIQIEFAIVLALLWTFIGWFLWHKISKKIAQKKYDETKNKSRKPEGFQSRTDGKTSKGKPSVEGQSSPTGRQLFQATDTKSSGKTSSSTRKSRRNPFRRK